MSDDGGSEKTTADVPHAPDSWQRFLFLVSRIPRLVQILTEFWHILNGSEAEMESYLEDLGTAVRSLSKAQTKEARREARQNLSALISRL